MVDKRIKQTRKKQQSITEKPTLAFDMWRFYTLVHGIPVFCGFGDAGILCAGSE